MKNRFHFAISLLLALSVLTAGFFVAGCGHGSSGASQSAATRFHCPMHPTYISDRPGDCPICGMRLVPVKDDNATGKAATAAPTGHEGYAASAGAAPAVPGRIAIALSPEKRQLIGMTLSKVEKRNLTRTVRTAALVEHDETRYAKIAPRFAGWMRKLHVNFTGAPVEKDQPLFTVYSPEVYSTENEYLIAWRNLKQLKDDAPASQRQFAQSLIESARLRLALFEVGEKEIRELEERGKASAALLFRAPFTGHVIVKNATEGKAFTAGETLYEVADLSHVWLRAYVFEFEMPLVSVGQDAVVNFPYLNNQSFPAQITFIYPHIEAQTRRGAVRLELDNPRHQIRPDMWANVELEIKVGEKLTVPASAVIDTGLRYVAFVEGREEHLEPREVKIGAKTDDYYEVLSGLKEGEQVVTRALFLVDSESQLKAAIADMSAGHQHDPHAAAAKPPSDALPAVLAQYVKIQVALAADSLTGVAAAAQNIAKLVADDPAKSLPAALASQATALAEAQEIAAVRERFKPLSALLIQHLERAHTQTGQYFEAYCDMAKAGWLQAGRSLRNPYFGKEMLECGEIRKAR